MKRNLAAGVALAVSLAAGCGAGSQQDGGAPAASDRNKIMQNQINALAHKLTSRAYGDFFVFPAHEQTVERVWADPGNRPVLEALVADPAQPLAARFLASEVLFARDFTFVPRVGAAVVADIYAHALVGNLTGFANSWGLLYEHNDAGPVGIRFVMIGEPAVAALTPLLDNDSTPLIYAGSKEATVGNGYHYRVKDFAAYYLGQIRRVPVMFHSEIAERDREIAQLKARLAP